MHPDDLDVALRVLAGLFVIGGLMVSAAAIFAHEYTDALAFAVLSVFVAFGAGWVGR